MGGSDDNHGAGMGLIKYWYWVYRYHVGLVTQANEYHSRCLSPGPIYAQLFYRNERGIGQERLWPRFKEIDFRDTGLREVERHTTIISGCFARKKYHFSNSKWANMKDIRVTCIRVLAKKRRSHKLMHAQKVMGL